MQIKAVTVLSSVMPLSKPQAGTKRSWASQEYVNRLTLLSFISQEYVTRLTRSFFIAHLVSQTAPFKSVGSTT